MIDLTTWLLRQTGETAIRARRALEIERDGDTQYVREMIDNIAVLQQPDGSFDFSPMQTAGVVNLSVDLLSAGARHPLFPRAASYFFNVLMRQPGYAGAVAVSPGSQREACDLCGFFGPYDTRNLPETLAYGAQEMNEYRVYEPLLGPKSPVRSERRSSLDRAGPSSCYAWGLIPLCYIIEALCRAGYAEDARLAPALNVLLGVQRQSGGWCRNLGGHPSCTLHALRALGAHPKLRESIYAEKALAFFRSSWSRVNLFAALRAVAAFDLPIAKETIHEILAILLPRQHSDGTFGAPCRIERVTAVLAACKVVNDIPL